MCRREKDASPAARTFADAARASRTRARRVRAADLAEKPDRRSRPGRLLAARRFARRWLSFRVSSVPWVLAKLNRLIQRDRRCHVHCFRPAVRTAAETDAYAAPVEFRRRCPVLLASRADGG